MPRYESVTSYIDVLQNATGRDAQEILCHEFMHACYEPDITDHDYSRTLEDCGIKGDKLWQANVECLDLPSTVALLTFVLRADHMCEGSLMQSLRDGYLLRVLRRLAELDGTWERPTVITFFHEYEKDGYLSNWYVSPFEFYDTNFPTGEHWMMWQKAMVFDDHYMASKILAATAQGTVKHLGKRVHGYSNAVWDAVNQQLMLVGLRQKFLQNEHLLNDLLSTGAAALGEAAGTKDAKWGVGFSGGDPKLDDPACWYGRNLLGRTLAAVRSDLRQLIVRDGTPTWYADDLRDSHVWRMSLLELARVPSTRPFALMYATIAARHVPDFYDAKDVLVRVRESIGEIDGWMNVNMGGGLPIAGWRELLDELALQVRLGRV